MGFYTAYANLIGEEVRSHNVNERRESDFCILLKLLLVNGPVFDKEKLLCHDPECTRRIGWRIVFALLFFVNNYVWYGLVCGLCKREAEQNTRASRQCYLAEYDSLFTSLNIQPCNETVNSIENWVSLLLLICFARHRRHPLFSVVWSLYDLVSWFYDQVEWFNRGSFCCRSWFIFCILLEKYRNEWVDGYGWILIWLCKVQMKFIMRSIL